MPTDPARVQELFLAALDLHDSAARAAYLDAACGDADLRARVEALLHAHDTPDSLLDAPVVSPPGGGEPTRTLTHDDAASGAAPVGPDSGFGFELGDEVGRGAMGVVYRARQRGLNRVVAVKMALGLERAARHSLARFLAEAEAVAAIDHPHVVRVYGFGQRDGVPFLAMEYLSGGTLADRLKAGALDPHTAAELMAKVASGVAAAHAQGIVHRDLKPGNVLLDGSGEPKVTDFGLARRGAGSDLTRTHAVMGTPAYMAPEQARGGGKFAGPPADVWALGVILYECVAGLRPFGGETDDAVLNQIITAEPLPLRARVRSVPRDLDTIVAKCLSKEPEHRYLTAAELADDLGRFVRGEPICARPVGRVERLYRWTRRKPTAAALYAATCAAAVLLGTVGVVVWQLRATQIARREAEAERDAKERARRDEELEREKVAVFEYGGKIRLAHQAWRDGDHAGAVKILDGTRPDLRGWEWHYVRKLCITVPIATLPYGFATQAPNDPSAPAYWVYWSPDGTRFVTGDGTLIDAASGRELATLMRGGRADVSRQEPEVRFISRQQPWVWFSPDGKRVLTGSNCVWDAHTGKLLATLDGVSSCHWSADGRKILTVRNGRAGWWDESRGQSAEGAEVPLGWTGDVSSSAVWSPDGTRVLRKARAWVFGRTLEFGQVWDVAAGRCLAVFAPDRKFGEPVAWSPDGSRVLSRSVTVTWKPSQQFLYSLHLWDARTGQRLATLRESMNVPLSFGVAGPTFTPDGRMVIVPDHVHWIRSWDARSGRPGVSERIFLDMGSDGRSPRIWRGKGPTEPVPSGPGRELVVDPQSRDVVRFPDAKTGQKATLRFPYPIDSAVLSPDGTRVLTTRYLGSDVGVWDARTGAPLTRFSVPNSPPARIWASWSPNGMQIATAATEGHYGLSAGRVRVWEAGTGALLATMPGAAAGAGGVAFGPDGAEVRVRAWTEEHAVTVFDAASGRKVAALQGHLGTITRVAISPDGRQVVTASVDHTTRVWDLATGLQLAQLPGSAQSYGDLAAWGPGGLRVAIPEADGRVRVRDGVTGAEVANLLPWNPEGPPPLFSLSPTGTRALLVTRAGGAWRTHLLDTRPARLELRGPGHAGPVGLPERLDLPPWAGYDLTPAAVAWSPDGTLLATGGRDGTVRLWDVATGRPLPVVWRHTGPVTAVTFGPEGDRLLTASVDGTAHIRDARGGRTLASLVGHSGAVTAAAFSPDGQQVATASADGTARVWVAVSGEELRVFRPHTAGPEKLAALSVAWHPNGTRLAVGCSGLHVPRLAEGTVLAGPVRVWDVRTGELVASPGRGHRVSWHRGGTRLLVSGTCWAMDAATPRKLSEFTAAQSGDGRWAAEVEEAKTWVRDEQNPRRILLEYDENGRLDKSVCLSFDPTGTQILQGRSRHVRVWDLGSREFEGSDNVYPGKVLKPRCVLQHTRSWNTTDGVQESVVEDFTGALWSPDGKRIATSHADGTARVWDAATGKVVAVMERSHPGNATEAVWSPEGRWVLTTEPPTGPWVGRPAASNGRSLVWDVQTGKPVREFPAGTEDRRWPDGTPVGVPEKATTVSPDGARKVEIGPGGTIRVLHAGTAAELLVLRGEADGLAGPPRFASWSPDGHRILIGAGPSVTLLDATPLGQ